jgi:hypothetical protein
VTAERDRGGCHRTRNTCADEKAPAVVAAPERTLNEYLRPEAPRAGVASAPKTRQAPRGHPRGLSAARCHYRPQPYTTGLAKLARVPVPREQFLVAQWRGRVG